MVPPMTGPLYLFEAREDDLNAEPGNDEVVEVKMFTA